MASRNKYSSVHKNTHRTRVLFERSWCAFSLVFSNFMTDCKVIKNMRLSHSAKSGQSTCFVAPLQLLPMQDACCSESPLVRGHRCWRGAIADAISAQLSATGDNRSYSCVRVSHMILSVLHGHGPHSSHAPCETRVHCSFGVHSQTLHADDPCDCATLESLPV